MAASSIQIHVVSFSWYKMWWKVVWLCDAIPWFCSMHVIGPCPMVIRVYLESRWVRVFYYEFIDWKSVSWIDMATTVLWHLCTCRYYGVFSKNQLIWTFFWMFDQNYCKKMNFSSILQNLSLFQDLKLSIRLSFLTLILTSCFYSN